MQATTSGPRDAPPVLLLHGGGVAGWMWESLRRRLEERAFVIVPDLPGHDGSAAAYVSHEETVRSLRRLLSDQAPDRKAAVIGFSLGAQLAVQLAADHAELVRGAIVVSAQAKPLRHPDATLRLLRATAPLARRQWFAKLQARELFIPDHLLADYLRTSAGISPATLTAAVGDNIRFRIPEGWSRFPGRTLVMVGGRERRLMLESAQALHAALPSGEVEIVAGCGHGIPLQRPEWFGDRVAEWLDLA